jgi:hypothetical protein
MVSSPGFGSPALCLFDKIENALLRLGFPMPPPYKWLKQHKGRGLAGSFFNRHGITRSPNGKLQFPIVNFQTNSPPAIASQLAGVAGTANNQFSKN